MRIAVAGGTGVVGTHLVELAQQRGHEVVVLSRSRGVDLTAGAAPSLAGIEVVVDVTSVQTQSGTAAKAFFRAVTTNLLAAESAADVSHHIALSIVGIEQAPTGYYAGKLLQEQLIQAGAIPWTILRATQFHEFARQTHGQLSLGPVRLMAKMVSQPVSAREVAARLVELAEGAPTGRAPDFGGPRDERVVDMVRAYDRATGRRTLKIQVPIPGRLGKALRDGSLAAQEGAQHGTVTFDDWLATQGQ